MIDTVTNFLLGLAQNRYLRAIRDGVVATLPLIMVGSLFLMIAFPPVPADSAIALWAKANITKIMLPYRMTMFIMTIYAVVGIGSSLAKSYDLDPLSGSIIAMTGYLLTITPSAVSELWALERVVDGETLKFVVDKGTEGATLLQPGLGWATPMANLGSAGLFVGILVAILSVEILRFAKKRNLMIKLPEAVPPSVARSFEAIIPTAIVVVLMSTIVYWFGTDLHGIIGKLMAPLVSATDSLWSVLILVLLVTMFWSFGIHGVSIVGAIARPVWIILRNQNAEALAAGLPMPNVAPEELYQWFIWIGGSGATIGLAICFAFLAKSSFGKVFGKTVIAPAIFNINEPIIFGAPIVLNPLLIPPFIITPVACATISYLCVKFGFVNHLAATPPWTLPGPVGAFLATGGDIRGVILNVLLICLSVAIYFPFFKRYDNQMLKEELADLKSQDAKNSTSGVVA